MRNPYITGAYVRGHNHYGRTEVIDTLLHGESRAFWVIGNRRIGKTSLLRQIEFLTLPRRESAPYVGDGTPPEGRWVPLFWDMQGADTFARLGIYLAYAVAEQGDRLKALGLSPASLDEENALALLSLLRRAASRAGRELLVLCDEPEVLLKIARNEPEAVQRLHGVLTGGAGLRVVACSTRAIYQFNDICRDWPTSGFLAGFDMSQALSSLSPGSARALIAQMQAPEAERAIAAPEVIEAIRNATNDHPYLLQLLCSRVFQEDGTLRNVTQDDLEVDDLLRGFFVNDFAVLTALSREIVQTVHEAGLLSKCPALSWDALSQRLGLRAAARLRREDSRKKANLRSHIHDLERLGYLREVGGRIAIGNRFLDNWLSYEWSALADVPAPATSESAVKAALSRQQVQEARFLTSRLNKTRARLVELEAVRAKEFLAVRPEILSEIEQAEAEVRHLRGMLGELRSLPAAATIAEG